MTVQIPYCLTFAYLKPGQKRPDLIPGRGNAGWTLSRPMQAPEALDFLRALPPSAWMPGTKRLAACLGYTP